MRSKLIFLSVVSFTSFVALSGCPKDSKSDADKVVTDGGSSSNDSVGEASEASETVASSESAMDSSETLASSESAMDSSETLASSESAMDSSETGGLPCSYPAGAVEPMTLGEVLVPYSWTTAIHADGTTTSLELLDVPCATDEVIDWSVHELLVFISLPAW